MSGWVLIVLLATGEAGSLPAPEALCRRVPAELAAGGVVTVELRDGRIVVVAAAVCVPPPCRCEAAPGS